MTPVPVRAVPVPTVPAATILVKGHSGTGPTLYPLPCGRVHISKPQYCPWWRLQMSGVDFYRDTFEQIIGLLNEIQGNCAKVTM